MKRHWALLLTILYVFPSFIIGRTRSSGDYSVSSDSISAGGTCLQSTDYSVNGSALGEFAAGAEALADGMPYTNKFGFVGQLYDLAGLNLTSASLQLNEGASRQLEATLQADDATILTSLDPSTVTWSIVSGPINSISPTGRVTAANVFQDTPAVVGGSAQALNGQIQLTVLNVTNDDFDSYANDQIDDNWQVQYFGENNLNAAADADADGTGQTNLFKFVAGLNPLDGSRFVVEIQPVEGQLAQMNIMFSPVISGRTYTVQSQLSPTSGTWDLLTGIQQLDNGPQRIVTDLNPLDAQKFYRVQITKP